MNKKLVTLLIAVCMLLSAIAVCYADDAEVVGTENMGPYDCELSVKEARSFKCTIPASVQIPFAEGKTDSIIKLQDVFLHNNEKISVKLLPSMIYYDAFNESYILKSSDSADRVIYFYMNLYNKSGSDFVLNQSADFSNTGTTLLEITETTVSAESKLEYVIDKENTEILPVAEESFKSILQFKIDFAAIN